jgi:hypothetical protein
MVFYVFDGIRDVGEADDVGDSDVVCVKKLYLTI